MPGAGDTAKKWQMSYAYAAFVPVVEAENKLSNKYIMQEKKYYKKKYKGLK